MKSSVFIATSLDGFIAREDHSIDWLDAANAKVPAGEDCGYASFMESVDVLVMGRNTFEKVLNFSPWPYEDKPVIVLSSRDLEIPAHLNKYVEHSSESPQDLHKRLAEKGLNRLYIDGGITIQHFLNAGLIDDITITVIPIIIGTGKTLFGNLVNDIKLRLNSTTSYDFGFTQLSYQVEK